LFPPCFILEDDEVPVDYGIEAREETGDKSVK